MVSITPVATQWFDKKRGLALVRSKTQRVQGKAALNISLY